MEFGSSIEFTLDDSSALIILMTNVNLTYWMM